VLYAHVSLRLSKKLQIFYSNNCNPERANFDSLVMFDEKEIIRRILEGDWKAFTKLVKQYERLVYHIVSKLVNDQDRCLDVCQDVFIKVHKNLHRFKGEAKLGTWIGQIAYWTAINTFKSDRRRNFDSLDDHAEQQWSTFENPEDMLIDKDVAVVIKRAVDRLPHPYGLLITLFHLEELSYKEIEEITDLPEGTIKSYLFRGRKLLKEKLKIYLKDFVK
jgi:RNA polymerase sigma factor (sigma-70 family)